MNSREKFLETMKFNLQAPANKWEFGLWGDTVERWYREGLPQKHYPLVPSSIVNTTSSLYTPVWVHQWEKTRTSFEKVVLAS